jgi:hypothetical protein
MRTLTGTIKAGADVGYDSVERAQIAAGIRWRGLIFAFVVTLIWYAIWFGLSLNISAWAGLMVFAAAYLLGHGLAHMVVLRSMDEEIQRRRNLKEVAENYRKAT